MLACFHEDYRSEQPMFPARTFRGIDQVRKNSSALLASIPDLHAEIVRSAATGDTVLIEIHWTGTKADGTRFEERGVIIMGIRDDRIAWGRLYADEVRYEGPDIDAVMGAWRGPTSAKRPVGRVAGRFHLSRQAEPPSGSDRRRRPGRA